MCPDVKALQPGETPQKLVQKFPIVVGWHTIELILNLRLYGKGPSESRMCLN
jgi:hypothetical protein